MTWQFLFSRLECKNCTFPDMHRHFNSQLPYKANGTPVDSSLDILISVKVPWSTRSEDPYFFSVLFSLLYVYEMFERPTLGPASPSKMYLSYMRLCSSTRSEDPYFFSVLFSLLYVYEMFERPTLGPASPSKMYLSYMRLCSS